MCFWIDNFTQSKSLQKQLHYIIEPKSSFMISPLRKTENSRTCERKQFSSQQTQIIASFVYELLTNKLRMSE